MASPLRRTGWVWHERYGWHDTGTDAGVFTTGEFVEPLRGIESAESKRRFASLVEVSGLGEHLHRVTPVAATTEQLAAVHSRSYLDDMAALSAGPRSGYLGPIGDSPVAHGFEQIARLSTGGVIAAASAVAVGDLDNAYALVRPPGHHALPDAGLGYCVYANVAIAVRHVQRAFGVGKVAVIDWDVHHGNGTQAAFWEDPSVLTVSIHQNQTYPPGSGEVGERGGPGAEGTAINIPMPPGSGRGAYQAAFNQVVLPAVRAFRPEMIMIASGLDASWFDPLGRMMLGMEDYRWMAAQVVELAADVCQGKLVAAHEGGYSPFMVPFCGLAIVEEFAGYRTAVPDIAPIITENPNQELQPHQAAAVAVAREAHNL